MPSWTPSNSPRKYLQYDVFTDIPLEGNQLAVFLECRGLATDRMQAIAREMNFSESTFILPAEMPGTDVRMRIFTPSSEMPMAGHPTIGSTFALAETGGITAGQSRFVFGLNVGPTPVDLQWKDGRLDFAWMTQLAPEFGPPISARSEVAAAIGLTEADLVAGLPVQQISCGVPFLYVPLKDAATVDRAVSDSGGCRRFKERTGLDLPVFLFALTTGREGVYSRMFAPGLGVTEDPATGSASGPLGCYLVRHRLVTGGATHRIVSLQGALMKRPSRIFIDITEEGGTIAHVKVGGRAVLVGRGELLLPD
jgi:trans-2,3-dihydro-3-hydroxyanthranilate isomerase